MRKAKLGLLAALTLSGLVACTLPAMAQDSGQGKRDGRMNIERQLERMTTQLNLTPEQKPKVKAVLEERNKKFQEKMPQLRDLPREERAEKMRPITEETNKKLKAILTADQYKKYEEMRRERGPRGEKGEKKGNSKKKSS